MTDPGIGTLIHYMLRFLNRGILAGPSEIPSIQRHRSSPKANRRQATSHVQGTHPSSEAYRHRS
jgi:hypothetical protein